MIKNPPCKKKKNPPCNDMGSNPRDTVSIPGWKTKIPYAFKQLTHMPQVESASHD